MKLRFGISMAILGCALTASAQTSCTDQASCFQSAEGQVLESIRVAYVSGGGSILAPRVEDCYHGTCTKSAIGPISFSNYTVDLTKFQFPPIGQGFGPVNTGASTMQGYAQIVDGDKERAPLPANLYSGFTTEITAVIPPKGQNTTLTLMKIKNRGNMIWGAFWKNDQLILSRATPARLGYQSLAQDRPWDTSWDGIGTKVPVPPATDAISWATQDSTSPLLVEFYFTFTTDGKLRIDLFNINATDRDQWIEKLVETGFPVVSYPPQNTNTGNWVVPYYDNENVVRVGESGQNSASQGLLQYVLFQGPLSSDEILAYHKANAFFGGQEKPSTEYMQFGQAPCNTGTYLNVPPSQSVATPCGQIIGVGQAGSN